MATRGSRTTSRTRTRRRRRRGAARRDEAHPFYLTPRSTPASTRSRYFAAPVAAASSRGVAGEPKAESPAAPASAAARPALAAGTTGEKENETAAAAPPAKTPLFERFAFGAK